MKTKWPMMDETNVNLAVAVRKTGGGKKRTKEERKEEVKMRAEGLLLETSMERRVSCAAELAREHLADKQRARSNDDSQSQLN